MAQESLPIGEGGHVGGVDSQVHAVVRKPGTDGSHEPVQALVEDGLKAAKLRGEAVERVDRRDVTKGVLQGDMLGDERGHPAP